ncbi:MAG: hypothetical protein K6E30_02750 [Lachnospiraceae bacterium]|nr:hypothetical protein [Lachnospiraceae bacterium]
MEEKRFSRNAVFFVYFITMTILLLDCSHNFPGTEMLRKIKYLFIALLIADFLLSGDYLVSRLSAEVVIGLALHTLIFCLGFTNPAIQRETLSHLKEMLIYLTMLFFLVNAVERYHAILLFLQLTALSLAIYLLWAGLTHPGDFISLADYPKIFLRDIRVRHEFGTDQFNYMGYFAFVGMTVFYILYAELRDRQLLDTLTFGVLVFLTAWAFAMMVSTGSRGSLLSIVVFYLTVFLRSRTFQELGRWRYVLIILFFLLAAYLVYLNFDFIDRQGTRSENFTVNWPIFLAMGRFWTGMGYMESSGFLDQTYGFATWPVDIYYLYIFYATGILGFCMVMAILGRIFVRHLKDRSWFGVHLGYPLCVAALAGGVGQVNLFTYRYIATLIISVLLLAPFGEQSRLQAGK